MVRLVIWDAISRSLWRHRNETTKQERRVQFYGVLQKMCFVANIVTPLTIYALHIF